MYPQRKAVRLLRAAERQVIQMAAKQKILIVDDDNNIAELISLYLTKECFDTKIVNDGEEALVAFEQYNPNLILLDLMFPRKGRFTALSACKGRRSRSRIKMRQIHGSGGQSLQLFRNLSRSGSGYAAEGA